MKTPKGWTSEERLRKILTAKREPIYDEVAGGTCLDNLLRMALAAHVLLREVEALRKECGAARNDYYGGYGAEHETCFLASDAARAATDAALEDAP